MRERATIRVLAALCCAFAVACGPSPVESPAGRTVGSNEEASQPPAGATVEATWPNGTLTPDSTLSEWTAADARQRSALAVHLARRAKGEDAAKASICSACWLAGGVTVTGPRLVAARRGFRCRGRRAASGPETGQNSPVS